MDQFSHDLTLALEETSRRCGRRRTRSTGNLPCAPQPTEDSSSSPAENVRLTIANTNFDGLDATNTALRSDSDKEDVLRLPCTSSARLGALESDSLNETFSPARFFKPNARRKRKLKRMSVEYEVGTTQNELLETSLLMGAGKRLLKPELNYRSHTFFCGKRKRSNRDRYGQDQDQAKPHSSSVPRHAFMEEYRMRPRSFSSTSKPHSERLLPLNKGLLSKIERISQQQQVVSTTSAFIGGATPVQLEAVACDQPLLQSESLFHSHRKKSNRSRRRTELQHLQFAVDQHPMDCGDLNDFLSSSSISSSESEDEHTANDTDREGDDELTDWPGNECGAGLIDVKYDAKRKLTKKSILSQIKSDDGVSTTITEDDTLMSGSCDLSAFDAYEPIEIRYQPSEPITITNKNFSLVHTKSQENDGLSIPLKQIESEMSGETSNPFLSSPPNQPKDVREIRAGCRRVKGERPGFSIKTSVNERLARFLQDPRQIQIRLPDIEIYEHDSLINLATLYSLTTSLDSGCAVLTKTSNTTQSVNIDQSLQSRLFLSDFKRRCYDSKKNNAHRK